MYVDATRVKELEQKCATLTATATFDQQRLQASEESHRKLEMDLQTARLTLERVQQNERHLQSELQTTSGMLVTPGGIFLYTTFTHPLF